MCISNKHFLYLFIGVHCIANSIPTGYTLQLITITRRNIMLKTDKNTNIRILHLDYANKNQDKSKCNDNVLYVLNLIKILIVNTQFTKNCHVLGN